MNAQCASFFLSFTIETITMRRLWSTALTVLCIVYLVGVQQANAYFSEAQINQAKKTLRNMCLPKSGASKEALVSMNEGVFDDNDKKVKCYLSCVLGMMQVVKNNKINLTMLKSQINKMLPPEKANVVLTTFENCQDSTGDDQCELAYNMAKCIYNTNKEAFLVP